MTILPKIQPALDPEFLPAALWNRAYQAEVAKSGASVKVCIALRRPDETSTVYETRVLVPCSRTESLTLRYLERLLKFLLWQRGASDVLIAGCDVMTNQLAKIYSPNGERAFDHSLFTDKIYRRALQIRSCSFGDLPREREGSMTLGRHLKGCRIGFDLGGSDRKCAAVIDGKVVFSEEIVWNPYFEKDPGYHLKEINDTLQRAANHLPRVDAIGGSSAGVYVDNEVRVASLFRGVSPDLFQTKVRRIFCELRKQWNNVPFEVVNDGEVTALAGSMSLNENSVLGLAMGTSEAVGYVTPEGTITPMLNELAFAPIDYRSDAPLDEWSGDRGCGVQYLSQQAVARLIPASALPISPKLSLPEQLVAVQEAMARGDQRAEAIYTTLGDYLGYAIAHYADFYALGKVLLLGRVSSGPGGGIMIQNAQRVLQSEFPALAEQIDLVTPNERDKRHGQAVAAASLPSLA